MKESRKARPGDANQLDEAIVDMAASEAPDRVRMDDGRDAAAVALGRLGGLDGGRARIVIIDTRRAARCISDKIATSF